MNNGGTIEISNLPHLSCETLTGMRQYLDTAITVCKCLNFPLALNKVAGPTKFITYLGILIDKGSMTVGVPQDKLHKLSWSSVGTSFV